LVTLKLLEKPRRLVDLAEQLASRIGGSEAKDFSATDRTRRKLRRFELGEFVRKRDNFLLTGVAA